MTRPDHSGLLYVSLFLHPVSCLTVAFVVIEESQMCELVFQHPSETGLQFWQQYTDEKKGICGYLFGLC